MRKVLQTWAIQDSLTWKTIQIYLKTIHQRQAASKHCQAQAEKKEKKKLLEILIMMKS